MEQAKTNPTIASAIENYIKFIKRTRSENTGRAYGTALNEFKKILTKAKINPEKLSTTALTEDLISKFILHLQATTSATEQLYVGAVARFYKYLVGEELSKINLPRMELLIKQHTRKAAVRLPQSPINDVEHILDFVSNVDPFLAESETERLRIMRDRAFLLTLADTGLRVNEACNLRRGDLDWNKELAMIIGKGDTQAVVRFTSRAIQAIKDYLSQRAALDGNSGKQLTSLPLFARHDKGAGKKIKPMTPTTGRRIVQERVKQFLGKEMVGKITPHSFRHYFVTTALRGSGNLKLAQELARHKNIQVTQRYTHLSNDELDKAYYEIFENKTKKT